MQSVQCQYKQSSLKRIGFYFSIFFFISLTSDDGIASLFCGYAIEQYNRGVVKVSVQYTIIKATPTLVGEAFIFYLWTFFCHAPS